jgi:hypothetical protein
MGLAFCKGDQEVLKKEITYKDLDGNSVTDTFYFNLSKRELAEMQLMAGGSLADQLQEIVKSNDTALIIQNFKMILEKSFGVRAEDNKRFIKDPELFKAFSETDAYDELFMEILTNATFAAEFINGVMPKELVDQVAGLTPDEINALVETKLAETRQPDMAMAVSREVETVPTAFGELSQRQLTEMPREELEALVRRAQQQ